MSADNDFFNGPIWSKLQKAAMGAALPIFAGSQSEKRIYAQGTVTICVTEESTFGITAAHVVRGLDKHVKEDNCAIYINKAKCYGLPLIDIDDDQDIATFYLNRDCLRNRDFPKAVWPPRVTTDNVPLLASGYPSADRIFGLKEIEQRLYHTLAAARSVTHDKLYLSSGSSTEAREGLNLGGASGGPIFSLFEVSPKIVGISFCGIITQAHQEAGLIVGARLDAVQHDGEIAKRLGVL